MAEPSYRITPTWKDLLIYDEGGGREMRFDAGIMETPYWVTVPSADLWAQQVPEWARDRRSLIVDRLRAAGCVICEKGDWIDRYFSPDGTFRVEVYFEPDDRGPPRRSIRIIANDGDQVLVNLYDAGLTGPVGFPSSGILILPFEINGERQRVTISIVDRTFWSGPVQNTAAEFHGNSQPLEQLPASLILRMPDGDAIPFAHRAYPQPSRLLKSIAQLLICGVFVAGGIWQMFDGRTTEDHLLGALSSLFFAACGIVPVIGLRRWARRRI